MQGGAGGYSQAALSGAGLAAKNGAFGANTGAVNTGIGYGTNLLGAYQGFSTGGVAGNAEGALNVAELGARAGAFGSAADTAIGQYAPFVGAALADFNAVKNWQSGNTGGDALNGAEAGASTGAAVGSIVPGIGTAIGAVAGGLIGGVVGAASSAFGGGKADPETTNFNSMVAQNAKSGGQIVSQLNPSQAYQSLAGMMDAKDNTAGHSTQLELAFGRMGEGSLMTQMTQQINDAIQGGKISPTANAQQLYSQVVEPWLQSKNAYVPQDAVISSNGTKNNGTVDSLLTQLIGQWQSGALTAQSQVGVSGQTIAGLPSFAGQYSGQPQSAYGVPSATPSTQPTRQPWYSTGGRMNVQL